MKQDYQHLRILLRRLKTMVVDAPKDDKTFIVARLTHSDAETTILALEIAVEQLSLSEKQLELWHEHLERIR